MKFLLFIVLIFLLYYQFGCSILEVKKAEEMASKTFRKDLKFEVDGKVYTGTAVLPRKTVYEITFYPETSIDRYIFQTCHRDDTIDKPKTGWFSNKYVYKFLPQTGIEDSRACALEVAALEKKQNKNGFAYIEFKDLRPEISLKGYLKCNGNYTIDDGVGVCQSAAGLRQEIFFQQKVLLEGVDENCKSPESEDGFFWSWNMKDNKCVYYFVAKEKHKNGKRLAYRLNAIGFTFVPVRE